MKEKFTKNGIEYVKNGDYYLPNLTVNVKYITSENMAGCTQNLLKRTALVFILQKCLTELGLRIFRKLIH